MADSYNPNYQQAHTHPEGMRFSRTEVLHLAAAVLALSIAFSFVLSDHSEFPDYLIPDPTVLAASFAAVASGFVLHELAHKFLAQHYGHWAEFRAQFPFLGLTFVLAAATKLLFAAPGAVMIRGPVTVRENGLISLVGPGVNLVIAGIALPFTYQVNTDAPSYVVPHTIAFVNALLGLFNLIPMGPLDGRKVWAWNKAAYLGAVVVAAGVFVLVLVGT